METGQAHAIRVLGAPESIPAHLAALVATLHEPAMLVRARDRVILDANVHIERVLGWRKADLVGRSTEIVHVDHAAFTAFGAKVQDVARGAGVSFEWPFRHASGARVVMRVGVAGILDAEGALFAFVGTFVDLTAERRLEGRAKLLADVSRVLAQRSLEPEAILGSVAQLATRHLSDYVSVELFDADGRLQRLEVAHADPAREAQLRAYRERYPPDRPYAEMLRALPAGVARFDNGLQVEQLRAFLRDDAHVDALVALGLRHSMTVPLRGRSGPIGALAFSRTRDEPFTDHDGELALELGERTALAYESAHLHRQLAEQLSRVDAMEARWRSLVEHASDWIYLADRDGVIQFLNRAREGTTIDQIVGRSLFAWLTPDEADRVRAVYDRVFEDGRSASVTTRAVIRGREEHYEMRIGPVVRDGRVVAATVTSIDVTQRVEQQRALEAKSRVVETLHRVQVDLARNLDVGQVVQTATDAATSLTGAAFGAFFYNVDDGKGQRYTLYTLSGAPREAFARFPMPRNTPVFAPTFSGSEVVRSDDITKDPRYGHMGPHHGMPPGHLPVRSYLAVPVVSRTGEVHGGLFFGHPEPGRFGEGSQTLVVGIAAQTANALDNAHLYRRAKESEAQLADAQRIARLGSWSSDPATGALDWSEENYRIHGIPPGEPVSTSRMFEVIHPDDRERIRAESLRILQEGEGGAEYRLLMPDGTVKHVQGRGRIVRGPDGRPARGVGTTLDITDRVRAEEALRQSEERFRTLLAATTQMVWHTDADGLIGDMPEWRAFTGQSEAEVRGAGWIQAIHPEDQERVRASWAGAFAARSQYECEYRVRSSTGEYRWFLARGVPRLDERGRLLEYIGTWTDVTDRRLALLEAEALRLQLAQSEKLSALGSLVGGVAHEIRTPLTYLANNLALIETGVTRALADVAPERRTAVAAMVKARMEDAQESIERIDRIVQDLRKFTKVKQSPERTRAPLPFFVSDAVELFRATHKGDAVLLADLRPTPTIEADRVQVQQVVLNLLQNAVEARPADARVQVRTYEREGNAVLEVADRGEGIPAEVLARIWDPFFTTKAEGNGLGLSIVKRILDAHRATVHVETAPGQGTCFRVTFPARAPA